MIAGLLNIFTEDDLGWNDFGYLLFSIISLSQYYFEISNQYLTIENGMIKKNSLFSKKMQLSEIKSIKKFAGEYTLITQEKEMKINTEIINDESLNDLNLILDKLNVGKK